MSKATWAFARNILEGKRKEEIKKVSANDITHKSIAILLIVSHVRPREGRRKREEKARHKDFDSHYRYVSANETIRASPTGTLMAIRLYPMRKNARGRSTGRNRDKKEVATDRHKARESIIIIAPVNPRSRAARYNPR